MGDKCSKLMIIGVDGLLNSALCIEFLKNVINISINFHIGIERVRIYSL